LTGSRNAPVLVENLLGAIDGQTPVAAYEGYAACPIVTGYGRLILAKFDYDLVPRPSFPFDTTRERWSLYQLKRHVLPRYYWHGLMRGRG
jgi:sulfide:quinone oxidoreductase